MLMSGSSLETWGWSSELFKKGEPKAC